MELDASSPTTAPGSHAIPGSIPVDAPEPRAVRFPAPHLSRLLITNTGVRAEVLVVGFFTLVGLFLRVWRLDNLPPGLWWDEAQYGLQAMKAAQGRELQIFFQFGIFPVEPLYVYLMAPFIALFGNEAWAVRLPSVLAGTLTLPIFYLFAREWFNVRIAMVSLVCLVFLRWHIQFSRLGFSAILVPPFMLLAFTLLHRGLVTRRMSFFIWSGAVFGMGLYTYIPYRLIPLVFIPWFLWYHYCGAPEDNGLPKRRYRILNFLKPLGKRWLMFTVAACIVMLPLAIHFIGKPYHFYGRTQMVGALKKDAPPIEKFRAIAENTKKVALMFSFSGDAEGRNNIPGSKDPTGTSLEKTRPRPLFDPATSVFFLAGVAVTIWKARRSHAYALILFWIAGMAPASILSSGAPSFLRLFPISPMVALFLGVGLLAIADWLIARGPQLRKVVIFCATLILTWYAGNQVYGYFITYPRMGSIYYSFSQDKAEIGQFANDHASEANVFIPGDLLTHPSLTFFTTPHDSVMELKLPDALSAGESEEVINEPRIIVSTVFTKLYPHLEVLYPAGQFIRDFRQPKGYEWAKDTDGVWARAFVIPAHTRLKSRKEIEDYFSRNKVFPYI